MESVVVELSELVKHKEVAAMQFVKFRAITQDDIMVEDSTGSTSLSSLLASAFVAPAPSIQHQFSLCTEFAVNRYKLLVLDG